LEAIQQLVIQSAGPFMNNAVTQVCNGSTKNQPIGFSSQSFPFQDEWLGFWGGKVAELICLLAERVWLWRPQLAGTGSNVNFLHLRFLLAWISFLFSIIYTSIT